MNHLSVRFQKVSYTYDRATQTLIQDLSLHMTRGWTGIVGANGAGKSTILKLATGALKPRKGRVDTPELSIYCQQRTDDIPPKMHELIQDMTGDAFEIKGRLGIEDDWVNRWGTLSHGERKRAQIGVALWRNPQVLAVDEPTNHLDAEAKELLYIALSTFHGIGILVSHDRRLLDDLCHQCLFVDPPEVVLRPGNYTDGLRQAETEEISIQKQRNKASHDYSRLKRESSKRRSKASQANRRRSKRGMASGNHDSREKINRVRVTGKDGMDGKRLKQLEGRLNQVREKLVKVRVKKKYNMGIWMPGAKSKRNALFNLPAGSLDLGGNRRLLYPNLSMKPDDRIALTGSNGSGKSTLIKMIMHSLSLEDNFVTYLPQEIDLAESQEIMERARNLPGDKLGHMMTIVSRLGSRPHRLLESTIPSPGEIRKILLATGITNLPHLIIMDEPTNHLDLPSIECLEHSLCDCPCGLILVSHDHLFLNALTQEEWHISENKVTNGVYHLTIR